MEFINQLLADKVFNANWICLFPSHFKDVDLNMPLQEVLSNKCESLSHKVKTLEEEYKQQVFSCCIDFMFTSIHWNGRWEVWLWSILFWETGGGVWVWLALSIWFLWGGWPLIIWPVVGQRLQISGRWCFVWALSNDELVGVAVLLLLLRRKYVLQGCCSWVLWNVLLHFLSCCILFWFVGLLLLTGDW